MTNKELLRLLAEALPYVENEMVFQDSIERMGTLGHGSEEEAQASSSANRAYDLVDRIQSALDSANAETEIFAFVYPGNGRLTGRYCEGPHSPWKDGGNGIQCVECDNATHYETDGVLYQGTMEEFYKDFLREEHMELGHREHVPGCPRCEH